ncbi:hypothetical protein D7V83_09420 [bacterium 0.1xD8-71]|nr:hypothetical protein D7V83_09420 [bacterium 0.1xD8-71]
MYRYVCGFHPDMGREIMMTIKPMPDRRFSYVRGRWESVFGTYVSNWSYHEDEVVHRAGDGYAWSE